MKGCVLVLLATAALASGCSLHGSHETSSTTTTRPPVPVPVDTKPSPMALTIYRLEDGVMRPRVVQVARTQAVAGAALAALGIAGGVTIANGVATVTTQASLSDDQVAEVVYTLTQFASVQSVDVAGRIGLTRDDFASDVPAIQVESPASGAQVSSPFHVKGTASVFEATLVVQVVRDGKVLQKQTVTASAGAPARGAFDTTLEATPGPATVQLFAPSASDGAPQHEVDVDVTVTP